MGMVKGYHYSILFVLGVTLTHGCCDPPSQYFDIDEVLTEEDVSRFIEETLLTHREEIDCHRACYMVLRETLEGWQPDEYDTCTFSLDAEPGENPTDEVGWVKCSGTVVEYYCD